jgi:hypothetical protein
MRVNRFAKAGIVVCLLLLPAAFLPSYLHRSSIRIARQRRDELQKVFQARLVPGTDPKHILALLDAEGIQRGELEDARNNPSLASVLGAPEIIEARVTVRTWSLTRWSIHFVFRFDDQGKYTNCTDKIEGAFY